MRKVGEVLRPRGKEVRARTGGYAFLLWMGWGAGERPEEGRLEGPTVECSIQGLGDSSNSHWEECLGV